MVGCPVGHGGAGGSGAPPRPRRGLGFSADLENGSARCSAHGGSETHVMGIPPDDHPLPGSYLLCLMRRMLVTWALKQPTAESRRF